MISTKLSVLVLAFGRRLMNTRDRGAKGPGVPTEGAAEDIWSVCNSSRGAENLEKCRADLLGQEDAIAKKDTATNSPSKSPELTLSSTC